MSLIDALNAASHPFASAGAASDNASGYTKYLCADTNNIHAQNFQQLFGAGAAIEDEMLIALPDTITPELDGLNRFDFSDISTITDVIIALFRVSASEWTSADLNQAPTASAAMSLNYFVADGSNYIVFPTLGVLTDKRLRIVCDRFKLESGTFISQAESRGFNQEFNLHRSGNTLQLRWGGDNTELFEWSDVFGSNNPDAVELDITFNTDETFQVLVNGVDVTLTANTYSRFTSRADGMQLLIGGVRDDNNPANTGADQLAGAGSEFGNTRVYVDDVLVRDIVMPDAVEAVEDVENQQNGTAFNATSASFSQNILTEVTVNNQSELDAAIANNQAAGAIINLQPGSYGPLDIDGVVQTINTPIILRGAGQNPEDVDFNVNASEGIHIQNSRYIALMNLQSSNGLDAIEVSTSQNIVMDDIIATGSRQAGLLINKRSRFVDLINSHIHNTGQENPQYAEGIYIGTGGSSDPIDVTSDVWIEGNEINNTGNGEAVDIKAEQLRITVHNNNIHDIAPGTSAASQINQAAISWSGRGTPIHEVDTPRDVWITNNSIRDVTGGSLQNSSISTNHGIMIGDVGAHVLNNSLENIDGNAIYGNGYGGLDLPLAIDGNTTNNVGAAENIQSGVASHVVRESAVNPNKPQRWLHSYVTPTGDTVAGDTVAGDAGAGAGDAGDAGAGDAGDAGAGDSSGTPSAIVNSNYDSLENTLATIEQDGLISLDQSDVDNRSNAFFNYRTYIPAAARAYAVNGDINLFNKAIALCNAYLNRRDDVRAQNGEDVFPGAQTGYRSAPLPLLATDTPAAVWSFPFLDKSSSGNAEAEGRRAQVLDNARIVSAFATVVEAYYSQNPAGTYTPPDGAESGLLSGSYESVISTLLIEINKTVRIFDALWQQDYTGRIGSSSAGSNWVVSGSYFYEKRQNLSLEGIDTDNVLPWNHSSGMLYARIILNRYSDLDSSAVDHFNRWYAFFNSIASADDASLANPGLADITQDVSFGLQPDGGRAWNYVAWQGFPEDIDHVIITLEVFVLAFRTGLLTREQITPLFSAVESVYLSDSSGIYDRIYDQSNGQYDSFPLLPGAVNLVSQDTNLQSLFANLLNASASSGQLNIREEEAVLYYHLSEQLPLLAEQTVGESDPVVVTPADTEAPVITIAGYNSGDTLPPVTVGTTNWAPPTATATDNTDGDIPVTIDVTGVDINAVGNHLINYSATDADGNQASAFLTVPVQAAPDTVGPQITISGGYQDGDTLPAINEGGIFNAPSATAFDNEEAQAVTVTIDPSAVNAAAAGTYALVYRASDSSGNETVVTLNQPVVAVVVPPVINEPLNLDHVGNTTISLVASRDGEVDITILNADGSIARDPIRRSVTQGYNAAVTLGGVVRAPQRIQVEPVNQEG